MSTLEWIIQGINPDDGPKTASRTSTGFRSHVRYSVFKERELPAPRCVGNEAGRDTTVGLWRNATGFF
jgi:hypothetical protein